jgi:cytochrome c553
MNRSKQNIAALAISAGFAALIGPIVVTAQSVETSAPSTLEARLVDERTLFAATVKDAPDDDLLELGRLVAMGGTQNGGSGMACITCHGGQGAGDGAGSFPRLTGQAAWYTYKQLNDYASGARPNKIMSGISQRLTEREREAVAAYYAVVRAPISQPLGAVDQGALQWGGQLAAVGSAEMGIPACVNCHGPRGTGNPPSVPYLAGQYANYMTYQLELWKDGVRDNDAMNVMSTIAKKMSSEDMRAVSEYYNRVHNPQTTPE